MRIKTEKTVKWTDEFNAWLAEYSDLRPALMQDYDPTRHSIQLEVYFYLNYKEFFTQSKKRTISKRSIDLDNMLKVGNDLVFKWLEIDDSQITKIFAEKIPTDGESAIVYQITLTLIPPIFSAK
jgi:Holliday junction resolvase RusA-like endonuclease